jgi:transglutaminase-like putative cysteine protease
MRAPFLADPVVWAAHQPAPVATTGDGGPRGWIPVSDGSFFWDFGPWLRPLSFRYVQVYRVPEEPDLSPPFRFSDPRLEETLAALRHNPVPRVKEYADRVLADMIARGELPADDWRDEVSRLPRPEFHDAIARAFTAHLTTTPTLAYTTELRREDKKVDPVEDFLFHSRAGHCERFATALVLMLRSQGIPAVFVLGFKGCEHQGGGRYLVSQEHAHAWVEALVSRPGPPTRAGQPTRVYHWRSLDPTPGGGAADAEGDRGWLGPAGSWVQTRFDEYVKDYTPEKRRKALSDFAAWFGRPTTLAGLGAAVAVAAGVWVALRRRGRVPPPAPEPVPEPTRWFGALVALLAAHGIVPSPGDTAREYAEAAASALRERAGCAGVAEVPLGWAEAYYQDRFGGVPPSEARLAELEAGLDALRRALS